MKTLVNIRVSDNTFIASIESIKYLIGEDKIKIRGSFSKEELLTQLYTQLEDGDVHIKGYISNDSQINPTTLNDEVNPLHLYIISDEIRFIVSRNKKLVIYVNILGKVKMPKNHTGANPVFLKQFKVEDELYFQSLGLVNKNHEFKIYNEYDKIIDTYLLLNPSINKMTPDQKFNFQRLLYLVNVSAPKSFLNNIVNVEDRLPEDFYKYNMIKIKGEDFYMIDLLFGNSYEELFKILKSQTSALLDCMKKDGNLSLLVESAVVDYFKYIKKLVEAFQENDSDLISDLIDLEKILKI